MNIQTLNQTIKTLEGLRNAVGSFTRADVDLTLGLLRREFEAQPAQQQEPVAITEQMAFAFHNAITDGALGTDDLMDIMRGLEAAFAHISAPQPAQRTPLMDWVPVTQELLNEQPGWLYEPMWIAMKDGSVLQGHYEWRQGWNPDRLLTDGGDRWAFDSAYVMPMVKPTPPAEAKHGIKENT